MKTKFGLLALIFLTGLIQNCATGSGRKKGRPTADGNYYLLQAGYSCTLDAGETITSNFSDRIEIKEKNVTEWGDDCNDAVASSPLGNSEVYLSADNMSLIFRTNLYEYRETRP